MQPSPTRDVHIESMQPLTTPRNLVNSLPITPAVEKTVLEGREQVRKVLNGEDLRLLLIVGPCSIHSKESALEYAGRLKELSEKLSDRLLIVMRVYFEKPRTTVGWKGLIYDPHLNDTFDIEAGLRTARSLLLEIGEMGMYAGTEFLDPVVPSISGWPDNLGHHRRPHHRKPDPPADGQRPEHARRIQERHRR